MLIIPSRGRPHNFQRLIDSCKTTGCTTPAWIRLDDDDPRLDSYLGITLPTGWTLYIGPRKPLSDVYNEAFALFTPEFWGFIADDVVPETPEWDKKLIEAAGRDGMAVPSGSNTTGPCPHFFLGADLPKMTGWLCLPGLNRLYIDTVWHDIAKSLNVYRCVPDVILAHYHFSNKKALYDNTYKKPDSEQDRRIYADFIHQQLENRYGS